MPFFFLGYGTSILVDVRVRYFKAYPSMSMNVFTLFLATFGTIWPFFRDFFFDPFFLPETESDYSVDACYAFDADFDYERSAGLRLLMIYADNGGDFC